MERRILEWLPDYDIAENGEIRRITQPKKGIGKGKDVPYVMKQTLDQYLRVNLMVKGVASLKNVHALVCEAFNGPKPTAKHVVAHCDGNPMNNRASNLRWATQKENLEDMDIHGTRAMGEKVGSSKLKAADIPDIRKRRMDGEIYRKIAEDYGVTIQAIHYVCNGGSWSWL